MTRHNLPDKENWELAEDMLSKYPSIDRAKLMKDTISLCFYWLRWGNKREEKQACDILNEVQRMALKQHEATQHNTGREDAPANPSR